MRARAPFDLLWQPSPFVELGRYALASAVVLLLAGGAVAWLDGRAPEGPAALGLEDAVLLDLPPAPASSAPVSDAVDGPKQQASEAVAPPPPPKEADPAPEPQHNQEDLKPAPPVDRGDIARASPKPEPTPPPVAATPAQEEMAPASSPVSSLDADPIDSEAANRQAAQALTQWQKAMLNRLEAAKAGTRSGGLAGTVEIAFTIDRKGNLLSRRIARGSGSSRLDQAALGLLNRAAPFPVPPNGTADAALSFTVPIVFVRK